MVSICISIYLLVTILIGFWAARRVKTSNDYILAGQNLPAVVVGVTIFSTWFGSEMIMGVPGYFIKEGWKGLIIDAGGSLLCLSIISLFFVKPIYELKILTINDYFKIRYNKSIELTSSLILIFSYFSWVASQLLALAYIFQSLYGWEVFTGVLVAAGIIVLYTFVGGMWAVSLTDLIQAVVMILGLLYIFFLLNKESEGIVNVLSKQSPEFRSIGPDSDFYSWTDYFYKWAVFGIGAIVSQEIYQRVLSAKSQVKAKNGVFIGGLMMATFGILPSLIGLLIVQIYPELLSVNDGQNLLPEMVNKYMSVPVQVIFFGALISAILSTSSGAILAPATVLAENIIKPNSANFSDKKLLHTTRLSVLIMAIVSCMYTLLNDSIHDLVVNSVTLITTCLTAPFVLGVYWKKSNVAGTWAGILAGAFFLLLGIIFKSRIEPMLLGLVASFMFMYLFSIVYHKKTL